MKSSLLCNRVAYYTLVLFISDTLVTIGASFVLFGKLRKTNDIYKMSVEIRKLGAFALLALCKWKVFANGNSNNNSARALYRKK